MAHSIEGATTYQRGYNILNDVAVEKANTVCPDGNDGSGSVVTDTKSPSYLMYGRGRRTIYLVPITNANEVPIDAPTVAASASKGLSSAAQPPMAIPTGTNGANTTLFDVQRITSLPVSVRWS